MQPLDMDEIRFVVPMYCTPVLLHILPTVMLEASGDSCHIEPITATVKRSSDIEMYV
jgi:hypothetical protein